MSDAGKGTATGEILALAVLASEIAEGIGFRWPDADTDHPESDEHLNAEGAWEYRFETDDSWGWVAGGPKGPIETSYPMWGEVEVPAFTWMVFHDGALAGMVTPKGGTVGGFVVVDGVESVAELEPAMIEAFRTERDAVTDEYGHD